MNVNFDISKFSTDYSYASPRSMIRTLSDSFSKQFCNGEAAIKYAAKYTKGRCLYCGQPLYKLSGSTPIFSNLIHYDHIYPASKFNLFEVGNVALACETCNLAKSNRLPMDYYDMRTAEKSPLLIYEREDFEEFLNNMTAIYRNKWPKHYEAGLMNLDDDDFKDKLTELLYNKISIACAGNRYNHENSVNRLTWEKVVKKAYVDYSTSTAKDVEGRIGFTNEMFEKIIGHDVLIESCKLSELKSFMAKLVLAKYDSKNEVTKYRMLLRLLIEVLNEDMMEGQLEGAYKAVPTFSEMNK